MDNSNLTMSLSERKSCNILIVEDRINERVTLKGALRSLDFNNISEATSHSVAIKKLESRNFTHMIFQARKSDMLTIEFLEQVLSINENLVCIPSSSEPKVDDVFALILAGASGYLCFPFTLDSLDVTIIQATKGDAISDDFLRADDRNEALISIAMTNLDSTANLLKQAKKRYSLKYELEQETEKFRTSCNVARIFAQGGDQGFLDSLQKFLIKCSWRPTTKLGKLRRELSSKRMKSE
jgi:DNA-binding NarL/FixJ family response regulator